jgi:hypothetical protein
MHLFTFNFKQEAPVLAFIALVFLACEIGLRVSGPRTSIDIQHIRTIPQIVTDLNNARHPTLLFLGNSLTRRGVIPEVLTEALAAQGFTNVHIAMIYPDDTNIADWLYLYKRYVRSKGVAPDILLVGFSEEQLSDSQGLHIDRLGRYFGGIDTLSEAFHYDVQDLNDRVSYLLASLSCAYADRDRVRTDLFGVIIPHYKTSAQVLNKAIKNRGEVSGRGMSQRYKRLTRFLELTTGTPTKVVFVAIPLPALYPLDPSLQPVLLEKGSQLIDLRNIGGITDADFLDGYHLTPHGGAIYTRELSRRLLESAELRRSLRK